MTTIRASCPACGDVDLTVGDVAVRVCSDDNSGSFNFRCPGCEVCISKPTDPNVVELLVSSGVRITVWQLPAELFEFRSGEPINHDDLMNFHDAINDSDQLAEELKWMAEAIDISSGR